MNDFDRLIGDSLKTVGEDFRAEDLGVAQREFVGRLRRRFWLQVAGGVAVAASVVAAVFFLSNETPIVQSEPIQPGGMSIIGTIDVGDRPIAISGGDDLLWVANSDDSTVTYIDGYTGEADTLDVPAADEIAVGGANAWVGGSGGRYVSIDVSTKEINESTAIGRDGPSDIEDIAVGGTSEGAAWMVLEDGCVWEATIPARVPENCDFGNNFVPTDVATDNDETYLLQETTGRLFRLHSNQNPEPGPPPFDDRNLPRGQYGDLLNDFSGGLWISGAGGLVTRVDLNTGQRVELQLDGDYADLAVGYGFTYIWALVGNEGEDTATLYRIDANGGATIGDPIQLDGKPSDIAGYGHEAWITLADKDQVVRVTDGETNPAPVPAPTDSATPSPTDAEDRGGADGGADPKSIVMVFSKDGDIYAAYGNGKIKALTETSMTETDPVFVDNIFNPKYPAVLYVRAGTDIFFLDTKTMEEQPIVPGGDPASGGIGGVAWLKSPTVISYGTLFSEPSGDLTVTEGDDPNGYAIDHLAWGSQGSRFLYALTSEDFPRVASVDYTGELGTTFSVNDSEHYYAAVSQSDRADMVDVIRICCGPADAGAVNSVELGTLNESSRTPQLDYEMVLDLSELPFAGDPSQFRLTQANNLSATPNSDGTVTWGPSDTGGWIVGDGVRAFLVDLDGYMQELPFEVHAGMDVYEGRSL